MELLIKKEQLRLQIILTYTEYQSKNVRVRICNF